jgi:hypothetical protein
MNTLVVSLLAEGMGARAQTTGVGSDTGEKVVRAG